jgi:hypothetical protein
MKIHNLRLISRTPYGPTGAGQVLVEDGFAYIAPMKDVGTTIVDVRNPKAPKIVAQLPVPANTHSHKVQVAGGLMVVNNEKLPSYSGADFSAGVGIYDVSNPTAPKPITFFATGGTGVHRFWFADGRYAHLSAGAEGYSDQIYRIIDLARPDRPEEVGRWGSPGCGRPAASAPTGRRRGACASTARHLSWATGATRAASIGAGLSWT